LLTRRPRIERESTVLSQKPKMESKLRKKSAKGQPQGMRRKRRERKRRKKKRSFNNPESSPGMLS